MNCSHAGSGGSAGKTNLNFDWRRLFCLLCSKASRAQALAGGKAAADFARTGKHREAFVLLQRAVSTAEL